jgi:hypothetical protein
VWSGTFKLRINHSRFGRNEGKKSVEVATAKKGGGVYRPVQHEVSFKDALVPSSHGKGLIAVDKDEVVLKIPVDSAHLQNLKRSFVGFLLQGVEVRMIRTTLLMEGLQNISVTSMGGNMVLIQSTKLGELERRIKAKEEWLGYYFFDIKPWSPVLVNVNREVWVKVYGIPIHAWGDNLFKLLGARFGEFVDYDEPTASKLSLDVARLKLSTPIRSRIETPVAVSVMGVIFEVWVVEEEAERRSVKEGEQQLGVERSWGGSSCFPVNAEVACDDVLSVSGEDKGTEGSVDLPHSQHRGRLPAKERDNPCLLEEKGQCDPRRSNQLILLENERMSGGGKELVTLDSEEREVGGARGEVSGEKLAYEGDVDNCDIIMKLGEDESAGDKRLGRSKQFGPSGLDFILLGEELDGGGNKGVLEVGDGLVEAGPGRVIQELLNDNPNQVEVLSEMQDDVALNQFSVNEKFIHHDPISTEADAAIPNLLESSSLSEKCSSDANEGEGVGSFIQAVKKQGGRGKLPLGCGPKFLQLVEAVKEVGGGGRRRKVRGGGESGRSRSVPAKQGRNEVIGVPVNVIEDVTPNSSTNGVLPTAERNFDLEGLNLEVVLPCHLVSPSTEGGSQEGEVCTVVPETQLCKSGPDGRLMKEAKTIMGIQKKVGFSFPINEVQYVKKLIEEEIKDQEKLKAREQQTDDQ